MLLAHYVHEASHLSACLVHVIRISFSQSPSPAQLMKPAKYIGWLCITPRVVFNPLKSIHFLWKFSFTLHRPFCIDLWLLLINKLWELGLLTSKCLSRPYHNRTLTRWEGDFLFEQKWKEPIKCWPRAFYTRYYVLFNPYLNLPHLSLSSLAPRPYQRGGGLVIFD